MQFSWLLRIIQNKEGWTGEAPPPVITRCHWNDHQEGPGSELRTSSGCGHQPETLRETNNCFLHSDHMKMTKTTVFKVFPKKTQCYQFYCRLPERLKEDSWRSRIPCCIRVPWSPLPAVSPSMGPKPSSFFIVFATLATSPE